MTFTKMLFIKGHLRPTVSDRQFHSSASCFQPMRSHRLFSQIDWDRVEGGLYAVVDPFAPSHILYLSENDYIIQVRVAQTNNKTLKVLATPEDTRDSSDTSQNSPPPAIDPFIKSLLTGTQSNSRRRLDFVNHLFSSGFEAWRTRKDGKDESMVTLTERNLRTCIHRWHDQVHWWSRGKTITTVVEAERSSFSTRCLHLFRSNGVQFLILYLKGSLFAINSFLAGKKLSTGDLPGDVRVKLSHGLPTILPLYVRHGLRCRGKHFIHIWTSVTNMYKGIDGKYGSIDLSTITKEHPNLDIQPVFFALKGFASNVFWPRVWKLGGSLLPSLAIKTWFSTSKAGPAHPNAVLGAPRDASIWFLPDEHTGITRNLILEWLTLTGNEAARKIFRVCAKRYNLEAELISNATKAIPKVPGLDLRTLRSRIANLIGGTDTEDTRKSIPRVLGRLVDLYEPAGKIRIVAIVDYWTNLVLKPLHDWMFDLLRKFPTDATFDQEGRLKEFTSRGYTDVWSIDLTAATDTIPLALYKTLFIPILGDQLTELWTEILTGRNFMHKFAPKSEREFHSPTDFDLCRYGTGQPMGALSSWSSMAMVHHLLVQFAAFMREQRFISDASAGTYLAEHNHKRLHLSWFQDYLILGDDLVIADEMVAREYIRITALLGISVNMKKSFISERGFCNFANQSYLGNENVSPLSFKEFIGVDSLASRTELCLRAGRRGWWDSSSRKWLAPLLKMFINERLWKKVRENLSQGTSHPMVSWILSVLLVPGTSRLAFSGLPRVSIKHSLSAMLTKAVIWNKPLKDLDTLSDEWRDWEPIRKILLGNVNSVYQEFLSNRKRLEAFDKWLELTMSTSGEEILRIILKDQVSERTAKWTEKYRVPLKTLQVVLRLPAVQPHILEIGTEMTLDEACSLIAEGLEALPRIPPYEQLDAAMADLRSARGSRAEAEARQFVRLLSLVGNVEHLYSHTTPGVARPIKDRL